MAKVRSPVLGFNHNIRHRGWLFHVQTEDSGVANPHIFTHLFHEGVIIASKKVEYDADSDVEVVKGLMQAQHKSVMKLLKGGEFDEKIDRYLGPAPAARPSGEIPVVAAEEIPAAAANAAPDDAMVTRDTVPIPQLAFVPPPAPVPERVGVEHAKTIPAPRLVAEPPPGQSQPRSEESEPENLEVEVTFSTPPSRPAHAPAPAHPIGASHPPTSSRTTASGRPADPAADALFAILAEPPQASERTRPKPAAAAAAEDDDLSGVFRRLAEADASSAAASTPPPAPAPPPAPVASAAAPFLDGLAAVPDSSWVLSRPGHTERPFERSGPVNIPPGGGRSRPPTQPPVAPAPAARARAPGPGTGPGRTPSGPVVAAPVAPAGQAHAPANVPAPPTDPRKRTQPLAPSTATPGQSGPIRRPIAPPGMATGRPTPPIQPAGSRATSQPVVRPRVAAEARPRSSDNVIVARPAVVIGAPPQMIGGPSPTGGPSTVKPGTASHARETPVTGVPENIFGQDLISEKSLDEVIMAYLSEDSTDE